jgi:hypothetical protein
MKDKEITKQDTSITPSEMYQNTENTGTEEISQEDLNTPILSINQPSTQDLANKKLGYFHRSDTNEDLEEVQANLVYVTTTEQENYNKTGLEKVKIYYGYYADTFEPFKLFIRGWSLGAHKMFQTEISHIKRVQRVPMFALRVKLTTEEQKGTIKDSGKPYSVFKIKFTILKDHTGRNPVIEMDTERISFLFESATRFKEAALIQTESDQEQSETLPWEGNKE